MSNTPVIAAEKYVAFTTFKRDGTPVSTPVWIAALADGRVGFTTDSTSWKARRLANDSRCTVQASDARGRVAAGADVFSGTAQVVTGADAEPVQAAIRAKYRVWVPVIQVGYAIRNFVKRTKPGPECAVVISLDG